MSPGVRVHIESSSGCLEDGTWQRPRLKEEVETVSCDIARSIAPVSVTDRILVVGARCARLEIRRDT